MAKKHAHIIYAGTVQGVGFRWTVERIANELDILGWVRNAPDGTVEITCEGGQGDIELFMEKIKKAMGNYIRSSKMSWEEPHNEFDSFNIKF